MIMSLLLNGPNKQTTGFMIPIPQYPLYSATISEYNAEAVGYYLDEANGWSLKIEELERAYQESLNRCEPRALCLINPGNPTGQVLSLENIQDIIRWAYEKKLVILADEVILLFSKNFVSNFSTVIFYRRYIKIMFMLMALNSIL